MPLRGGEAGVTQREQVARGTRRAELEQCGQGVRRERPVEAGEDEGPRPAEQSAQCVRRCRGRAPQRGDAARRVDDRRKPGRVDDGRDVRLEVRARHQDEPALVELDRAAFPVGALDASPRPADLRVELVDRAAEAVPGHRARASLDVAVDERADPHPERRHERAPGFVDARGEQVSRGFRIGQQGVEQAPVAPVLDGFAAALELLRHLPRRRRADLRELVAESRLRRQRRRRQEVRHEAVAGLDGEQRFQVETGDAVADEPLPHLMVSAGSLVRERPDGGVRLPDRRAGEAHREDVLSRAQREHRHGSR